MELYSLLPEFKGPNMLPEKEMAHYRDNIRPAMHYCGLTFLSRLMAWCQYVKDFDLKAKNSGVPHLNNESLTTFKNIILKINDADCYDSYYCNVHSLAGIIHALMIMMAVLSIIGLGANLYCFIEMHLRRNKYFKRNGFGIYLASIIFIDCLHIVLGWFLFIVLGIAGSHYMDQLNFYQKFSYVIVPYLLPFWDLTCLIVTWLIIGLLVQRSNTTRSKLLMEAEGYDESKVMTWKKRKKTYCHLFLIIMGLFIYSIPKFLEYTFNKDFQTGKGIIIPLLRVLKLYRIIMLKFLSPSIECLIPIIFILAYMGVIKYHETVLTRRRMVGLVIKSQSFTKNLISVNNRVMSVSGVSQKTQLVIWISLLTLINLIMKLSAMFVGLEQNLKGSSKEDWPRLRQIVKYMSIIISLTVVSVKPFIYIRCYPRLLKRDLSCNHFKALNPSEVI